MSVKLAREIALYSLGVKFKLVAEVLNITVDEARELLTDEDTFKRVLEIKGVTYDGEFWLDKNGLPIV